MGGSGASLGNRGGTTATGIKNQLERALGESPAYKHSAVTDVLESASVGTKVYDGSTTMDSSFNSRPTYYEKTSTYGWTIFGDTENYNSLASNQLSSRLIRKSSNSQFSLRVVK